MFFDTVRMDAMRYRVHDLNSRTAQAERNSMRFRETILLGGKTATGIPIPEDILDGLGGGKRPAVSVTINGHTYRTTVGYADGRPMIPVSAENREAAKVAAGDEVEVEIELDTTPREVSLPADFAAALERDPAAKHTFDGLSYSLKNYHAQQIEGAKTPETRQRRLEKAIATLHEGKPR
jgi:Bacteriocin-protection, YdeI or OmpD-Associated/Domain of unknown function (DUF1905)